MGRATCCRDHLLSSSSDYNLFFSKAWSDSTLKFAAQKTLADWQKTGQDRHTVYADPALASIDPCNGKLAQPASSCANRGLATGNWADARGRLRGSSIDLGALETTP